MFFSLRNQLDLFFAFLQYLGPKYQNYQTKILN